MNEAQEKILNLIQSRFPLHPRPYLEIGKTLQLSEEEVLAQLQNLKKENLIRRVGAFIDPRRLNYVSTLVACLIEPNDLDSVIPQINQLPGVTHNYQREHKYNVWFTLITPDLDTQTKILKTIRSLAGVKELHNLPALKFFKLEVEFAVGEKTSPPVRGKNILPKLPTSLNGPYPLSSVQKAILRFVQDDLSLVPFPYAALARQLGLKDEALVEQIQELQRLGIIRRFGAALRHRSLGFTANGMSCWNIPKEKIIEAAQVIIRQPEITHCYERPRFAGFVYNVYAMIHGKSRAQIQDLTKELAAQIGISEYEILFSTKEFKRSSMQYF